MRPISNLRHIPMLDGIEVNVIDVALEIRIVSNRMLPVTALPNSSLASDNFAGAAWHIAGKAARKSTLDQTPAQRKIGIAGRQRPDGMEMVRQYANCDSLKCVPLLNRRVDSPESVNVAHKRVPRSVRKSNGKEKNSAFDVWTSVSWHGGIISLLVRVGAGTRAHGTQMRAFAHPTKLIMW